ncbi:MAG: DNA-binding response regulator [Chloroflexota bacterium]
MTKILLVEDETTLAETLAYNLRREGYEVILAADGETGLERARTESPDLIVLDIMLPVLDGLSVCRILLTARGTEVDKIIGLETGADDYVVKPFGLGEFLARVRAVLRRAPAPRRDELASGDLVLDLAARRVTKGGVELKLSHKAFDLLAELMRNRGAVLSRDLLLTQVWGYDYFGDSRTVDVHIRWLREKIEDDPSNPQRIVTVRGVGYRFEG